MVNTIVMVLICAAGWAHLFPDEAQVLINRLKYQIRMHMLHRATLAGAQELEQSLQNQAAQLGIDTKLVDQFLDENREMIKGRLENIYSDRILEDPDAPGDLS